jgi:hypothetical protein
MKKGCYSDESSRVESLSASWTNSDKRSRIADVNRAVLKIFEARARLRTSRFAEPSSNTKSYSVLNCLTRGSLPRLSSELTGEENRISTPATLFMRASVSDRSLRPSRLPTKTKNFIIHIISYNIIEASGCTGMQRWVRHWQQFDEKRAALFRPPDEERHNVR